MIEGRGGVTIGDGTWIAPRVMILTATHEIGTADRRAGTSVARSVVIGAGCWIGAGAIILPEVSIASGCVIAAGAVVTKNTLPDRLYAGVPAEAVKHLDTTEPHPPAEGIATVDTPTPPTPPA